MEKKGGTKRIIREKGKESECIFSLFFSAGPAFSHHQEARGRRPEFSRKKEREKKCTEGLLKFSKKKRKRKSGERHVGMSRIYRMPAFPLFFSFFSWSWREIEGWMEGPAINFFFFFFWEKSAHAAIEARKRGEREERGRETMPDTPAAIPSIPCHSTHVPTSYSAFSPSPRIGRSAQYPLLLSLSLIQWTDDRMRYSRVQRDRGGDGWTVGSGRERKIANSLPLSML